jgi:hypothetical protein
MVVVLVVRATGARNARAHVMSREVIVRPAGIRIVLYKGMEGIVEQFLKKKWQVAGVPWTFLAI